MSWLCHWCIIYIVRVVVMRQCPMSTIKLLSNLYIAFAIIINQSTCASVICTVRLTRLRLLHLPHKYVSWLWLLESYYIRCVLSNLKVFYYKIPDEYETISVEVKNTSEAVGCVFVSVQNNTVSFWFCDIMWHNPVISSRTLYTHTCMHTTVSIQWPHRGHQKQRNIPNNDWVSLSHSWGIYLLA